MINEKQLLKIITDELDYDIGDCEYLNITNEDDLHDYILNINICGIRIEDYDFIYYHVCGLIPQVFDDVLDYIDECHDDVYGEQMRNYYSMIAF